MPLLPGHSQEVIHHNISEMIKAGHKKDQAVAAALHNADKFARGGKLGQMKPMKLRNRALHAPHHGGLFNSDVPGRTDKLHISVPHNSYIIPADVVSGLGEGNTMAGGKVLDGLFPHSALQKNSPATAKSVVGKFANGGKVPMVDIIVAGGEYHIHPEDVEKMGGGDMKAGHKKLDEFVKETRNKNVKETSNLPGPKK